MATNQQMKDVYLFLFHNQGQSICEPDIPSIAAEEGEGVSIVPRINSIAFEAGMPFGIIQHGYDKHFVEADNNQYDADYAYEDRAWWLAEQADLIDTICDVEMSQFIPERYTFA